MTELRVLPVRWGDAVTVRCRRGTYLFDGGLDGSALPELLRKRAIRRLRVASCTAPTRERLGGILDLMHADFPVKEYWLPDAIREITGMAAAFDGNWKQWRRLWGISPASGGTAPPPFAHALGSRNWWLSGAASLMELAVTACEAQTASRAFKPQCADSLADRFSRLVAVLAKRTAELKNDELNMIPARAFARLFIGNEDTLERARLCGRLLLGLTSALPGGERHGPRARVTSLALAAASASLLAETTANIHFLKPYDQLTDHLMSGHPVKAINGIPNSPTRPEGVVTPETIFNLADKFCEHRRGLVYQYGDAWCSALFCGESGFFFLGRKQRLVLDRPTVVLAPRQGGAKRGRAYSRITSTEPAQDIWVRGDSPQTRKISSYFMDKQKTLCLVDCRNNAMQEILLQHEGLGWNRLAGGRCDEI